MLSLYPRVLHLILSSFCLKEGAPSHLLTPPVSCFPRSSHQCRIRFIQYHWFQARQSFTTYVPGFSLAHICSLVGGTVSESCCSSPVILIADLQESDLSPPWFFFIINKSLHSFSILLIQVDFSSNFKTVLDSRSPAMS